MVSRSHQRQIALLVAMIAGWIVAAELVLRVLWRPDVVGAKWYARISPIYDYGYEWVRPICEEEGGRYFCPSTQYQPIFPEEFSAKKDAETFRFVTVGGSHAAGEEGYPNLAENWLEDHCDGRKWESVNLAVRGNGSLRTLMVAEQAIGFDPDVLVLDFGGTNEFEDERDKAYREQLHQGIWAVLLRSRLVVIGRKLLTHYYHVDTLSRSTEADEDAATEDPENHARWNKSIRTNYEKILDLAEKHGVEVIIVGRALHPPLTEVPFAEERHQLFLELAKREGVSFVNLERMFRKGRADVREKLFSSDMNHYSLEGAVVAGRALGKRIASQVKDVSCDPKRVRVRWPGKAH